MAKTLWSFGHSECNRVKSGVTLRLTEKNLLPSCLNSHKLKGRVVGGSMGVGGLLIRHTGIPLG